MMTPPPTYLEAAADELGALRTVAKYAADLVNAMPRDAVATVGLRVALKIAADRRVVTEAMAARPMVHTERAR